MYPRYLVEIITPLLCNPIYKFVSAERAIFCRMGSSSTSFGRVEDIANIEGLISANHCGSYMEINEAGFNRLLEFLNIPRGMWSCEEIERFFRPYRVYPKPPPTNHKLGAPKGKLP